MKKMVLLLAVLMPLCTLFAQENDYRPIVEDGKVWKVGWLPSAIEDGTSVQVVAYYWLEEDSDPEHIANMKTLIWWPSWYTYKQVMRQYVCTEEYKDRFPEGVQRIGYMFEDLAGKEVSFGDYKFRWDLEYNAMMGTNYTEQLYTFYLGGVYGWQDYWVNIIDVSRGSYINGFKGLISTMEAQLFGVFEFDNDPRPLVFQNKWMEGIGGEYGPIYGYVTPNSPETEWSLMECRLGDEILYRNPNLKEGVLPPLDETKKRIDFTHIQKPQPSNQRKMMAEKEESLCGDFSSSLLGLELRTMCDSYDVCITNNANEIVYEKTLKAIDVLALNIDISEWTASSYTITVENDNEQFIGTFEPGTLTAVPSVATPKAASPIYYDLQGRHLTTEPERGVYIKDGRKYVK